VQKGFNINKIKMKHYRKKKDQVILKGLMRSGNTVLRLLLIDIFNQFKCFPGYTFRSGEILKGHSYEDLENDTFLITTWRDPRDIVSSMIRVEDHLYKDLGLYSMPIENYYKVIDVHIVDTFKGIDNVRKTSGNELLLKYENWYNNFDNLFDILEKTFNGIIDEDDRKFLKKQYSKNSVKRIQDKYTWFGQYDPITLIHGRHIGPNNGKSNWKVNIPNEYHENLNKKLKFYIDFWDKI
jgi:hypothetical protein